MLIIVAMLGELLAIGHLTLEENTEVIVAAKGDDKKETIYEIADLMYHVMVLMVHMGITVSDVLKELASRHIIDHKVKQEKMV